MHVCVYVYCNTLMLILSKIVVINFKTCSQNVILNLLLSFLSFFYPSQLPALFILFLTSLPRPPNEVSSLSISSQALLKEPSGKNSFRHVVYIWALLCCWQFLGAGDIKNKMALSKKKLLCDPWSSVICGKGLVGVCVDFEQVSSPPFNETPSRGTGLA